MEKRFEVFVDDIYEIETIKAQKNGIRKNLEDEAIFNFKRRKYLKKLLDGYEKNLQNRYNNLLRKIDRLTLNEVLQILQDVKNINVSASRYEMSPGNFIEKITIKDLVDGSYLYQGYNKESLRSYHIMDMLDIREELAKSKIDPFELKEIDKIDLIYSLYNYEYVMNDVFNSYIKFLKIKIN